MDCGVYAEKVQIIVRILNDNDIDQSSRRRKRGWTTPDGPRDLHVVTNNKWNLAMVDYILTLPKAGKCDLTLINGCLNSLKISDKLICYFRDSSLSCNVTLTNLHIIFLSSGSEFRRLLQGCMTKSEMFSRDMKKTFVFLLAFRGHNLPVKSVSEST